MEKVRIGNDIEVKYTVLRDGQPETFVGATDIVVNVKNEAYGKIIPSTFNIIGNIVNIVLDAADCVLCGKHRVILSYKRGNDITIDSPAFELVQFTSLTGGTEIVGVELVTVNISGDIGIAIPDNNKIDLNGLNSDIQRLQFDTVNPVAGAQAGQVYWSDEEKTLVLNDGYHTHPIGKELGPLVKNNSGQTILNGQACYVIGSTGDNPTIGLASTANGDVAQKTIGLATMDIPNNGFGIVTTFGEVNDINTSALTQGGLIYLGLNGTLTTTEPIAPTPKIIVGICVRQHAVVGKIFVATRPIPRLSKLSDVYTTTMADGEVLRWNTTTLRFETFNITNALAGKADLVDGKIPTSQLPAYVDDVLEYANLAAFPASGEAGKIYVALDTNLTYRWSGSTYVEISKSLALGETSATAYRGDWGKIAYDHSQLTNSNPHGTTAAQISNTPAGTIASTTVQAAINELDADRVQLETDLNLNLFVAESSAIKNINKDYIFAGFVDSMSIPPVVTNNVYTATELCTLYGVSLAKGDRLLRTSTNWRKISLPATYEKGSSVKTKLRIADYRVFGTQQTGAYKIKLPSAGIGFLKVYISIYKYTTGNSNVKTPSSKQIIISGMVEGSGLWKNYDTTFSGALAMPKIRVGNEGSSPIILLGETTTNWGSYIFIVVDKIEVDNTASSSDYSTTTISLINSETNLNILESDLSDGAEPLLQRMKLTLSTNYPVIYKYLADNYIFNSGGYVGAFCLKTPFNKIKGGLITLKLIFFDYDNTKTSNTSQELIISFYNGGTDGTIYSLTANSTGGNFISRISIVYDGLNWRIIFNELTEIIKFRHAVLTEVTTSYTASSINMTNGFSFSNIADITSWGPVHKTVSITNNSSTLGNKTLNEVVALSTGIKSTTKGNAQFIRNQLRALFLKLISKNEYPLNIVYNGDSITNFQNANIQDATIRPLGMYCPDTFAYKLWQMLNIGTYNDDYSIKSEMGNMEFIKADHLTKAVRSGTFISNITTPSLGTSGGHPNGKHEFFYTKNQGDYIDFTIDKDSIGFSVLIDKFSGTRTDGANNIEASDSIRIYADGILIDTITSVGIYTYQNTRLDYAIALSANPIVIRVENNSANKWMPIWGVEAWKGFCVRPINCGVASSPADSLYSGRNKLIGDQNPDLIIWQGNCLNDAQTVTADSAEMAYKNVIEYMLTLNCPILVLITHPMKDSSNLTTNPSIDPNLNDPNSKPNYYYMYTDRLRRVCSSYGVPYIDVANYYKELYSSVMPSVNYVDTIHLSVAGHALYTELLDLIFKFDK